MYKWDGGALANDGNIYACPSEASQILQINIQERTTDLVGPELGDYYIQDMVHAKWSGFVEGSDGFLYGIPHFPITFNSLIPSTKKLLSFLWMRTCSIIGRFGR